MIDYEKTLFETAPWTKEIMQFVKTLENGSFMRGRTGWIIRDIKNPESIYEHSCKMGLAGYYLFKTNDAIAKGVVHDFPEIKKPDYLPGEIDLKDKTIGELEAMTQLKDIIPNGDYWFNKWLEFERDKEKNGYFYELDKICPVIQSINYLRTNNGKNLEEFYPHARKKIKTPQLISLLDSLYSMNIPQNEDAYKYYFEGLNKINL
ncbi:MAG TPA: HD domain-containing protein [Candidatus Nanoarchaeia archaeon]|nr:HD domain-containing protein [Candidatus Nanoarchaeia archaeon]